MGRAGLFAVAVVLGISGAAAAADRTCDQSSPDLVHATDGPETPADVRLSVEPMSWGGSDVSELTVHGSFARWGVVEVTLISLMGGPTHVVRFKPASNPDTAPTYLACNIPAIQGTTLVLIQTIDFHGSVGPPRYAAIDPPPLRHLRCGLGATVMVAVEWFVLICLFAIISFVVVMRRVRRDTSGEGPIVISTVLAEALARRARVTDGLFALGLAAATIAAYEVWDMWGLVGSVWLLACISDYAGAWRAAALLERPQAIAELYGTNLVVRCDRAKSAIQLSRRAIKRARREALPQAQLQ